jgi:hypothetical protein
LVQILQQVVESLNNFYEDKPPLFVKYNFKAQYI